VYQEDFPDEDVLAGDDLLLAQDLEYGDEHAMPPLSQPTEYDTDPFRSINILGIRSQMYQNSLIISLSFTR